VDLFLKFMALWVFLNSRLRTLVSLSCKSRSLLYVKLWYTSCISTAVWRVK